MPRLVSLKRAGKLVINADGYVKSETFPNCNSFENYMKECIENLRNKGVVI